MADLTPWRSNGVFNRARFTLSHSSLGSYGVEAVQLEPIITQSPSGEINDMLVMREH